MMQKKGLSSLFRPVELTQGECWKTILAFSFPIIVSYLLQQVYTISDAAIVGQTLTAQEVAGVNDTSSLIFIFLQFAFGVSAGFCVVTSCNVGAHNPAGVRRSLTTQIVLSGVLTVVLTALALVLLDPMLAWINVTPDSPEVYRAAYTYCAIIFAGIGAQLFYNFICSFLRSMGDSVTPLAFLLFSTLLNVGLDLLFIVVFRWGVAGAAVATVSAQLVSTLGCFAYAFFKYPELHLHSEDWKIERHDIVRHLIQGIPLGLQFSVLAIGIIVVQSIVVQFDMLGGAMVSNAAQNGFGAANKVNSLLMTPLNGLGSAMTSFTAQNLGAGDTKRIKKGTVQSIIIMLIMAACSILIGLLLTIDGTYLRIFLSADKVTAETIRFGNSYLYVDLSCWVRVRPSLSRVWRSVCCCPPRSRAAWSARRRRRLRSTVCAWPIPAHGSQRTRCCVSRLSRTSCAKTTTISTAAARNSLSDKRTIKLPLRILNTEGQLLSIMRRKNLLSVDVLQPVI